MAEDRTDLAEKLKKLCSAELEEPAFSNSGATAQLLLIIRLCTVGPVGKKSRIWETPILSTDADSRTDTNLKRLRDLSKKKKKIPRGPSW